MSESWKKFETLITNIERLLAPQGAYVRYNDFIPDKITGEPRQVDGSIRYKANGVSVLITIECRERAKIDDVTWIEQLATKRKDIGASATIAVSSSGFTKPALIKARAY